MGTNFRRRTRRRRRRRRRRSRGGRIITKNDPDPPKYGDCRPTNKKGQDWCWTKDGVKKGVDGWSMKGNKQGNKSKQGNKQIDKLSVDEIKNKINLLKKDLFNFRFRKVNGQLEDTSKVSELKIDIAKLLTKLHKKN